MNIQEERSETITEDSMRETRVLMNHESFSTTTNEEQIRRTIVRSLVKRHQMVSESLIRNKSDSQSNSRAH